MSNLDLYWASNKDWYVQVGCFVSMRDDAPLEAKESYENCMKQLKAKNGQKE